MNDEVEILHNGQIFDPNIRQVPDDICKQLGLPINTFVEKESHPFLTKKLDALIPTQFWQHLSILKVHHLNLLSPQYSHIALLL